MGPIMDCKGPLRIHYCGRGVTLRGGQVSRFSQNMDILNQNYEKIAYIQYTFPKFRKPRFGQYKTQKYTPSPK